MFRQCGHSRLLRDVHAIVHVRPCPRLARNMFLCAMDQSWVESELVERTNNRPCSTNRHIFQRSHTYTHPHTHPYSNPYEYEYANLVRGSLLRFGFGCRSININTRSTPCRGFALYAKPSNSINSDDRTNKNSNNHDRYSKRKQKQKQEQQIPHKKSEQIDGFLEKVHSSICDDIIPQIHIDNHAQSKSQSQSNEMIDDSKPLVLLLGVSGGCDSVALFHSILQILDRVKVEGEGISASTSSASTSTSDDAHSSEYGNDDDIYEYSYSHELKFSHGHRATTRLEHVVIPCQIHVVHFDHRQRGQQSDGDRLLVEDLCQKNRIQFHCFYWGEDEHENENDQDSNSNESESKKFTQEVARDWRRSTSIRLMKSIMGSDSDDATNTNTGVILTAHHKDDNEETMLLKILRGVHITNISGMEIVQQAHNEGNIYFAKPFSNVRKGDIQNFLLSRNLIWREDESNASGKYLRNRVRNELIPLLADLVGGNDVLESRLGNVQEQSRRLKNDVSKRANDYLTSITAEAKEGFFPLPELIKGQEMNIAEEEALYTWVSTESGNSANLSYEKLKKICQQVSNYPERLQWKLNIGEGWDIERNGEVLFLNNADSNIDGNLQKENMQNIEQKWNLALCDASTQFNKESNSREGLFFMEVNIPSSLLSQNKGIEFVLKVVNGNESLTFLPPWRKGKNSMKIKDFLRGQKIPLHKRALAPIICLKTNEGEQVVAIFVEEVLCQKESSTSGRWVKNVAFGMNSDDGDLCTKEVRNIRMTKL